MRKHVAIALGTLALTAGIAVSGCSGGSDAEAESPVDITKFRAEAKERFGTPPYEAPWYRRITAINWANGRIEITADHEESESRRIPCRELWKLASEQLDELYPLDVVEVGPEGVEFGGCAWGSDAEAESPIDITKFRAAVKERFGTPPNEAPWYRHITAINWANGGIEITTDLDEIESRRIPACRTLWKLASEQLDELYPLVVGVVGPEGVVYGGCG